MDAYSVMLVPIVLYVPLHTIMIMGSVHHVLELLIVFIVLPHPNVSNVIVAILLRMGYAKNKVLTLIWIHLNQKLMKYNSHLKPTISANTNLSIFCLWEGHTSIIPRLIGHLHLHWFWMVQLDKLNSVLQVLNGAITFTLLSSSLITPTK